VKYVGFVVVSVVAMKCNQLNANLNPICHLLALLGAHHILHVSRVGVNAFWYVSRVVEYLPTFRMNLMPPSSG